MQFRLVLFRKTDNLVCCHQAKLMELTDKVRDEDMVDAGVCVVDEGNTSTWRLDDPQVLQRERDERRLKVKEEKLRVLRQKRLQKVFFNMFSYQLFGSWKTKSSKYSSLVLLQIHV